MLEFGQKTCSGSTLSRLVLIVKVVFPGMAHPWTSFILNGAIEDSSLKTAISLSVVLPSPVMSQRKLQKNFRIGRTPGTPDTSGSVTLRHSKGNQPWRWHHLCSSLLLFLQVITAPLFLLVFCPWNWSYGLSYARQAFHLLSHISNSADFLFWGRVS